MSVTIRVNMEHLLDENKETILAWATGDEDFLRSFIQLVVTHWSNEGSFPTRFEQMREQFLRQIGQELLADLQKEVIDVTARLEKKNSEGWSLQYAARTIYGYLQKVGNDVLKHDGDGETCEACQFVRALKEFYDEREIDPKLNPCPMGLTAQRLKIYEKAVQDILATIGGNEQLDGCQDFYRGYNGGLRTCKDIAIKAVGFDIALRNPPALDGAANAAEKGKV
jgi:hypothetical protein